MIILQSPPGITDHAYERAGERLQVSRRFFKEWVDLTYYSWIPVNKQFLISRNVKVSALGSLLYITPWTPYVGVALVLSEDKAIKTVIDFEHRSTLVDDCNTSQPEVPNNELHKNAINRIIDGGYVPTDNILRKALGANLVGPLIDRTLTDFVNGALTYDSVVRIVRSKHEERHDLYQTLRYGQP